MSRSTSLWLGSLALLGSTLSPAAEPDYHEEAVQHYDHYQTEGSFLNFVGAHPDADHTEAYRFQEAFSDAHLANNDEPLGYKLGFTGGQNPPGADAPLLGSLFDSQLVAPGQALALADFHNPILEVELAFRFSKAVSKAATIEEIRAAVESVAGCIEIPDLAYEDPDAIHGLNFIAHNVLAKRLVLFDWVPLAETGDLNALEVILTKPDGTEVLFDPKKVLPDSKTHLWDALKFAVEELARRDKTIEAGDIVITGCMGRALRLPEAGKNAGEYAILPGEYQVDFGETLGSHTFVLQASDED